ncbi:hypothetical protein EGH24_06105 [Halonotius terrestris]|uniref:Uncharacterized protein n=1 Tax=Halonotius terrestris TaxID=2487750 RepID=A0A8J8PD41_9EURY|nr:hypothetical protein [Halonotius terrestris]TQQ83002.1 hypothetical protein EGH24_06105 [Halonotius terrestris]
MTLGVYFAGKHVQNIERISSKFTTNEDQVFNRLDDLSIDELKECSAREIEVYARKKIASEWDIDHSKVNEPINIIPVGPNPSADLERWRITIPQAEGHFPLFRLLESKEDSEGDIAEDIFHETGHKLSGIFEGDQDRYKTVAQYLYRESVAMGAVLLLKDIDQLSSYYKSCNSRLEELESESPESHIASLLKITDELTEVLDFAESRLRDVSDYTKDGFDLRREYDDFVMEVDERVRDFKQKHENNGNIPEYYITNDKSVIKKTLDDIFLFTRVLPPSMNEKASLKIIKAPEESSYEYHLKHHTLNYAQPFFENAGFTSQKEGRLLLNLLASPSEYYYLSPPELKQATREYIQEARETLELVDIDNIKRYRTYLLNHDIGNSTMAGHILGYQLGRNIHRSDQYKFENLVKMTEDEAIQKLEPIMKETMEEFGLDIPLDNKIKDSVLEDHRIEYKNLVTHQF